jgi:tetratricopeptide (TPR) repeat protein
MASLLVVGGLTAGCDKQRETLAAAIQPRTVQQVTATANQKLAEGKFQDARTEGERFLANKPDPTGQLAWVLAKACAQLGEHASAIKYASQALAAHAVSGIDVMAEPMLEPVRTDLRLVALAAGTSESAARAFEHAPAIPPGEQAAPRASAAIGANGIEAKAGSVSVKLPD